MQTAIDCIFVVLMLGFLWLVLKELGASQKSKEATEGVIQYFNLRVDFKSQGGYPQQSISHTVFSVEEAQDLINRFHLFQIARAAVWNDGKQVAVMQPNGVLEIL